MLMVCNLRVFYKVVHSNSRPNDKEELFRIHVANKIINHVG